MSKMSEKIQQKHLVIYNHIEKLSSGLAPLPELYLVTEYIAELTVQLQAALDRIKKLEGEVFKSKNRAKY